MKNARESQLKKCIFLLADEFKEITEGLGIQTDTGWEGVFFSKGEEDIDDGDVYKALSEYFGVEVTSVHCDDCDYMGVWVVYKELEEKK